MVVPWPLQLGLTLFGESTSPLCKSHLDCKMKYTMSEAELIQCAMTADKSLADAALEAKEITSKVRNFQPHQLSDKKQVEEYFKNMNTLLKCFRKIYTSKAVLSQCRPTIIQMYEISKMLLLYIILEFHDKVHQGNNKVMNDIAQVLIKRVKNANKFNICIDPSLKSDADAMIKSVEDAMKSKLVGNELRKFIKNIMQFNEAIVTKLKTNENKLQKCVHLLLDGKEEVVEDLKKIIKPVVAQSKRLKK